MRFDKKLIIGTLCLAAVGGGAYGYYKYSESQKVVSVVPVSTLNETIYEEEQTTEGTIVNAASQSVYLTEDQVVKEVNVKVGDEVQKGDILLTLDTTTLELSIESRKINISRTEKELEDEKAALRELRNTTPGEKRSTSTDTNPVETEDSRYEEPADTTPTQDNEAWLSLRDFSQSHVREPIYTDDSETDIAGYQYSYLVSRECKVYGSFFQSIEEQALNDGDIVRLVTSSNDGWDGYITPVWQIDRSYANVAANSVWDINGNMTDYEEVSDDGFDYSLLDDETSPAGSTVDENGSEEKTYTAAELKRAISEKEKKIQDLDLSIRQDNLELQNLENQMKDGAIRAKRDGVVTKVQNPDDFDSAESFIEVSGEAGVFIEAAVSELMLPNINVGQEIKATSWDNGAEIKARIESIDPWPVDNSVYGSIPNVSYYSFTAHVEEGDEGLHTGDYVQMVLGKASEAEAEEKIVIPMAYIRKENGKHYVYKEFYGELKKQYVTIGKIYYGYQAEVLTGLTMDDSVAFPYGKNVKEGVKTKLDESGEVIY